MSTDAKEARRREILMAALQAFSEKGYDKTSMNEIVEISGLSKGTLYWYFKNKQAIFISVIEMVFADFGTYIEVAIAEMQELPPVQRLRNVLLGMKGLADEMLSFTGMYADFFNQAWQIPEVQASLAVQYNRMIDAVAPVIQEGIDNGDFRKIDARLTARTILGAIDGFWFQQILKLGTADDLLELHADIVVRGLMKDNDSNKE